MWTISHPANAIARCDCHLCIFCLHHDPFEPAGLRRQECHCVCRRNTVSNHLHRDIFRITYPALVHVVSHGIYRTFEFLRTPSLLHHYHTMETRRPKMTITGSHFKAILPEGLRNWLYALTINDFGFFSRTFDFIDYFLGLKFLRYDRKVSRRFAIMIASIWVVFSIIILLLSGNFFSVENIVDGRGNTFTAFIVNWKYFNPIDEILLALSVGFSVLCLYNIRRVGMFFTTLACSAATVGIEHTLLLIKHTDASNLLYGISLVVIASTFAGIVFYTAYTFSNTNGITQVIPRSFLVLLANLLLFALGLYCGCAGSWHCPRLGISYPLYCAGLTIYGREGILHH